MPYQNWIAQSAQHLTELVRSTGQFLYKYDIERKAELPGYNVLRHCGAVWAVHHTVGSGLAHTDFTVAIRPALAWLVGERMSQTDSGSLFVFERGSVKLGGTGLALLALATTPNPLTSRQTTLISKLGSYIVEQRFGVDDFHHKRRRDTMEILEFRSAYYTGEALFGLLSAGIKIKNEDFIEIAASCINSLVRRSYGIKEQNHWMMYAVQTLNGIRPDPSFRDYARRLSLEIIGNPDYRSRGTCTPIACRTEALLCAEETLHSPEVGNDELRTLIRRTVEENIGLQLQSGTPSGAFRRSPVDGEVRIDYIQHNLSSLTDYERLYFS